VDVAVCQQTEHQDPERGGEGDEVHTPAKAIKEEPNQRGSDDGDDLADARSVASGKPGRRLGSDQQEIPLRTEKCVLAWSFRE
jgi:hypothetical protein